jgi:Zn-dependent protease with chaperone function
MTRWKRIASLVVLTVAAASPNLFGMARTVSHERIQLIKEIQERLNLSFRCDFSISIGNTRKYAMANSGGVIIVDRSFLESADRGRIFFAIAHEYAHAYLEHDVRLFEFSRPEGFLTSKSIAEIRRQFEKEADGIAARKAKEMGYSIQSILAFILAQPDPEKGLPPEHRVYSKPKERADYILAVFQSS